VAKEAVQDALRDIFKKLTKDAFIEPAAKAWAGSAFAK